MYEWGLGAIDRWGVEASYSNRWPKQPLVYSCNNHDGDSNGRPGRVVAGDLEISVRAPRCDLRKLLWEWDLQWSGRAQPRAGWTLDQPPLRAVSPHGLKWKAIRCGARAT